MSDVECNFYLQEKDVYDLAYDIAQEFDKIINFLDLEQLNPLINKVINVLELLEQSVKKIEYLERVNSDFKSKNLQLTSEKGANEEERSNLKQAFEELEESWMQESVALKTFISKLKSENKLLQNNLADKNDISLEIGDSYKVVIDNQEILISKLKTSLKQRDNQIEKNSVNIEALNAKIEQLSKLNKALHIQYQQAKDLMAASNLEKGECEAELHHQKEEMHYLEDKFYALKRSLLEKSECSTESESRPSDEKCYLSEDNLNFLLQEQHELKQKVSKLQEEVTEVRNQNEEYKRKLFNLADTQNPKYGAARGGRIPQIFRLFLGVINVNPEICWFRGI